jgi:hypothetical protein
MHYYLTAFLGRSPQQFIVDKIDFDYAIRKQEKQESRAGYRAETKDLAWRKEPTASNARNLELLVGEDTISKIALLASRYACTNVQVVRKIVHETIQSWRFGNSGD